MKRAKKTIGEIFDEGRAMDAAARRAVREAIADGKRLRKPSAKLRKPRKAA